MGDVEPIRKDDELVTVRVRREHFEKLTGRGLPIDDGHGSPVAVLQFVAQPDGAYGIRLADVP